LNDVHVGSPRHRHQASLDGRDLDFLSMLKSGAGRPQSAILTDDDELNVSTDLSRKRSSLVTGRLVSSNTPKASPKRVTFFDEIINSKERGVPRIRTDAAMTDRRQRGGHEDVDDDSQVVNSDAITYDFDEGSPSRKTSRTDGNRLSYAHRAFVDSALDIESANMLTSSEELRLSSDSIEANEIDDDFSAYGLVSVGRPRSGGAQNETQATASKSPKTRVGEALSDLEFMAGRHQEDTSCNNKSSSSGAHIKGDVEQSATSSAARASFELARTALTQYADLVRAAQESTAARRSWTPPAVRRVLPTPPVSTLSSTAGRHAFEYELATPPEKHPAGDSGSGRSPEPTSLDGGSGSGSGSADEVDFETFDGEELDSIGDAMIDSIDGSSVQSEDSIAMLPHLSDVDDDDLVDDKGDQVTFNKDSVTASDELTSTACDYDNGNALEFEFNERTVNVSNNSNVVVDVNLLNDFNNAVTCRQLAFPDTQTCPEITNVGRSGECLVVGISDSHAETMTTGITNDIDYFLLQSTTIRDERPMSLISSSSSTDTGE